VEVSSSLIAATALLLWIPFSVLIFALVKPHKAVAFLLVFATLFLPELEFFDIKLLPNMNKKTIACAWVFIPAVLWCWSRLKRTSIGMVPWLLFALMLVVDVGRAVTNQDPIVLGRDTVIPPILLHTALTFMMEDFLLVFVPFFLGAAFFNDRDSLRDLMKTFVAGGLCYVPLVVIEIRASPQLHAWVYGYHQHTWLQVMRDGAYRPMVFMHHGLAVALFMATAAMLGFGLAKGKEKLRGFGMFPIATLLALVLAASHSLGALVFVVFLAPLVWFTSPRTQLRVAVLLGALVMLYPMLRAYDWFPTKMLVNWARAISEDRAGSIMFRFFNEDLALKRAFERPIFGWGGFDRIFVYDKTTGEELSTLDGAWLITYCASGVLGFFTRYGLLTWPIWRAFRRVRRVPNKSDQMLLAGVGVTTAMVAVDLLPNGMFTFFPHLLAGVLLGATRQMSRREAAPLGAPARASTRPAEARAPAPVAARQRI
jgi:hypothetical protein